MVKNIVLVCMATIPVLLFLKFIFDKDTIEKEPIPLLCKLFTIGMLSSIAVIFISRGVKMMIDINDNFYNPLIEELCKWIAVFCIVWRHKEFDYKFDAIVYCIFVSLGFAFVENVLYALNYGITTSMLRAIISVPCHAFFAIYMGYYLGIAKANYVRCRYKKGLLHIMYSMIIPSVLHGIYNYCLMGGNDCFYILFIAFIVVLYLLSFTTVNSASATDTPLK